MRHLNNQQHSFVRAYLKNGMNGKEAYFSVYGGSRSTAKRKAYQLLQKPHIQEEIARQRIPLDRVAFSLGLSDLSIMGSVKLLIDAKRSVATKAGLIEYPDYHAIAKGIELWAKLLGKFSPEKREVNWVEEEPQKDYSKLSKEELEAEKASILVRLRKGTYS